MLNPGQMRLVAVATKPFAGRVPPAADRNGVLEWALERRGRRHFGGN